MAPIGDGAAWGGSPGGNVPGPFDEMGRVLAEMPRPRRVRMSQRGKTIAVIVSAALLASLGVFVTGMLVQPAARQNAPPPQFLTFALPIVLVLILVPLMLRAILLQQRLLSEGELAIARVTKRWMSRNGPNIRYEFTTPLGEHFSRHASDASRQLNVGMSVPIFYDSQSPKEQLALCASFYELILPGENNSFGAQ
jgi:hypothetical protein